MKCDICGDREAVVFIHQSNRGAKSELRLCAACAKSQGVDRLDGDVSESLSKLLSAVASVGEVEAKVRDGRTCPRCGASMVEVRKRGLVGCASCWLALAETAAYGAAVSGREAQGKPSGSDGAASFRPHVGRLPARIAARRAADENMSRLRALLAAAVQAEDYETAARCRDRIKELDGGGADA